MANIRIGVLLEPQLTSYAAYIQAVRQAEALGVDSLWDWDHFIPPYEPQHRGSHFEAWTLLAAMAALTRRAEIGCLVSCNGYRNPALLATMAKTVDHVSGGRLILGIGAGWFEREFHEYGYPYGTARQRLEALETALTLIKLRWQVEQPPPVRGRIPILVGGEGERITLRLAAQHADIWNGFGPPERYRRKCAILERWCEQVGRDPTEIERSVLTTDDSPATFDRLVQAGARHIILQWRYPWEACPIEQLVRWREALHH